MEQPPLASSPPAMCDGARPPRGRLHSWRGRCRLATISAGPLLLFALGSAGRSSPSSRWIGVADAAAAAPGPTVPIAAARAAGATEAARSSWQALPGLAFVVAGAGARAPNGSDRRSGPLTVRWDSEGGEPQRGSRRVFAPFKVGALARLDRPRPSKGVSVSPLPPLAASSPPARTETALGAGLQQIWDAVQGKANANNSNQNGGGSNTAFKILLGIVACAYGANFGAIKYLDEANVDVSIVTAIRFALASGALAPFLFNAPRHILVRGLEVGLWVAFGYVTQAIGLQDTQASKSAFICSLSVVVVPIVNAIVYKKRPPPTTWLASILAVIGVGMLTLEGDLTPSIGDLWSLGQPLGFGVAFVRTEQCMSQNKDQALAMTAAQMLGVFMCALAWVSFTLTSKTPDMTSLMEPINIAALVYTGVVTSALAVVAESVALAHVSAEETTVILSTEPLWAALFGAAVLGEKLDGLGYLGGLVILVGCILTQAKLPPAVQTKLEAIFVPGDADFPQE